MTHIYDDIIDMPHPELHHPRMAPDARAAQFASFAALTGLEDEIADTGQASEARAEMREHGDGAEFFGDIQG